METGTSEFLNGVLEQPVWKDKMTQFKENRAMVTCAGRL